MFSSRFGQGRAAPAAEIGGLQAALAGSCGRPGPAGAATTVLTRSFEAVERVWSAVNDLSQLKMLSGMMAVLKFKEVAKESGTPKMQEFLSLIGKGAPDPKDLKLNVARHEEPFLPELAWAAI